jgi:peptidoglycan/xylan/chitin deacetylase (PgdA/CDA1 family)
MTIGRNEFEKQIRFLKKHYDVITPSNLNNWLRSDSKRKGAMITFDDGYDDNYLNAFPILKKYSCPGVFFISTGLINTSFQFHHDKDMQPKLKFKAMTWDQLKICSEEGIEIGVHSHTHKNLNMISYDEAVYEIDKSIDTYKEIFHKQPHIMSYPFGGHNDISEGILNYVSNNTEIEMLFSAYGNKNISTGIETNFDNFYDLKRINIGSGISNLIIFKYKLEGALDTLFHPYQTYNFLINKN